MKPISKHEQLRRKQVQAYAKTDWAIQREAAVKQLAQSIFGGEWIEGDSEEEGTEVFSQLAILLAKKGLRPIDP